MNLSKLMLALVVLCVVISAADKIDLRSNKQVQELGAQRMSHEEVVRTLAGAGEEMGLKLLKKTEDGAYRYVQLFNGVPVWGHTITLIENQRGIECMHGDLIVNLQNEVRSVAPTLDAQTALENMKQLQRGNSRAEWIYENEKSELVVFINKENAGQLCYDVSFFADVTEGGQPTRPTYLVDATTGEVVEHFDALTFESGFGPGGNKKVGRYEYGKEYPAFEVEFANGKSTMRTKDVVTVNLNHSTYGSTPFSFEGQTNTVKTINDAYSPLNDAHYFGIVTFKLYKEWYNTTPLTFQLMLRVHYSNNYENAFWNGSSMTFGDGKSYFYPLVSLDVVAHEVSHGFTEQNSGLVYRSQSGGINEAFSDIVGEAAKFYMLNTNDWMVGANIFKQSGALRYFKDPTLDGRSIGSAKSYYEGMDVHYSSGVYNKAFYLLATLPGWNTKKAFDVFILANQKYWPSNATFVTGAQGVRDAAKALGYSAADVVTAFQGVDVTITVD